jgi:energy-coupling factor transport system permease protein
MRSVPLGVLPLRFMLVYLALCLPPVLLDIKEDRAWARLRNGEYV